MSKQALPPLDYERAGWERGLTVCGMDEAGRGPLFGPLVVGAVILSKNAPDLEAYDSKTISKEKRTRIAELIIRGALDYSTGVVSALEIDSIGLSSALLLASSRALEGLESKPQMLLIDGKHNFTGSNLEHIMLVKGEKKSRSIAAASVIAKVERDRLTAELAGVYQGYGLDRHGGYGTREHIEAIKKLGPTIEHRWSFAPINKMRTN
jgi:ribonuclease HII